MAGTTRRAFLGTTLTGAAGLALFPFTGCAAPPRSGTGVIGVPPEGYPLVDVKGATYRELGRELGSAMRDPILEYFHYAANIPGASNIFNPGEGGTLLRMLKHAWDCYPQLVEELKGMAEALDIPFMVLFAYNCRSEIAVLRRSAGCSTIAYCGEGRMVLAHNEDGNDLNAGRMFIARVTPPKGVKFMAFVYPGLLPGNGPGFNSQGVVQTTNYIEPRGVADGVPRYFIGRAILEAESLDRAVDMATTGRRAFPWHHNLASLRDGTIRSVETCPWRSDVLTIQGTFIHTNHLIHPEMAAEDGTSLDLPYESSLTRKRVLEEAIREQGEPKRREAMVDLLSLHEGRPYSPCRHPEGKVHGATLGTAVFEGGRFGMTLYHGNPCLGFKKEYAL